MARDATGVFTPHSLDFQPASNIEVTQSGLGRWAGEPTSRSQNPRWSPVQLLSTLDVAPSDSDWSKLNIRVMSQIEIQI